MVKDPHLTQFLRLYVTVLWKCGRNEHERIKARDNAEKYRTDFVVPSLFDSSGFHLQS